MPVHWKPPSDGGEVSEWHPMPEDSPLEGQRDRKGRRSLCKPRTSEAQPILLDMFIPLISLWIGLLYLKSRFVLSLTWSILARICHSYWSSLWSQQHWPNVGGPLSSGMSSYLFVYLVHFTYDLLCPNSTGYLSLRILLRHIPQESFL